MIDLTAKRVLSAASVLLLVIPGTISYSGSPAPQYSLKEAVDEGLVRARICSGEWLQFFGYSLDLEVENTWSATILVFTTLGRICLPENEDVQSMVMAKEIWITLHVGETKKAPLIAYCMESGDEAPSEEDCFELDGVAEELIPVLTVINNRGITEINETDPFALLSDEKYLNESMAAQFAIWWVLEGREEIGMLGEVLNISGIFSLELVNEIYEESLIITPTTPPATTAPPPPQASPAPTGPPPTSPHPTTPPPKTGRENLRLVAPIVLGIALLIIVLYFMKRS